MRCSLPSSSIRSHHRWNELIRLSREKWTSRGCFTFGDQDCVNESQKRKNNLAQLPSRFGTIARHQSQQLWVGKINTSTIKSILRLLTLRREWMTLTFDSEGKSDDETTSCMWLSERRCWSVFRPQLSRWSYRLVVVEVVMTFSEKKILYCFMKWVALKHLLYPYWVNRIVDDGQWFSTFVTRDFLIKYLRNVINYKII